MLTKTKLLYGKEKMSIYKVYDEVTKKFMALKISRHSHPTRLPTKDAILYKKKEDAREEVKILHNLPTHPNIVTLIKYQTVGNYTSTVMECAYTDLFELMEYYDHADYDLTLHIISDMVQGLNHLHSNGIAHLDISLENTLLCEGNIIKLCDFGLAIHVDYGYKLKMVGKKTYMAPEMFSPTTMGDNYDYRKSDIYSLGICILCMVTGTTYWNAPTFRDKWFSKAMAMGLVGFIEWVYPNIKLSLPIKKLLSMTVRYLHDKRSTAQDVIDYLGTLNIDHTVQKAKLYEFTRNIIKRGLYDKKCSGSTRRITL
jgi:serine/threonine protein kinase